METFTGALQFILPIFFLLILIEALVAKWRNKDVINSMDTLSSLTSGLTNILFKTLGLTFYVFTYDFLLEHFAVFTVQSKALQYFIGFIAIDFYAYWWHRLRHEYNILWNEHVIHHSSEEYNLPVALRQTISDTVNPATILLLPAAIFGIGFNVIVVLGIVMLFGGFWYHTQLIGKMGFLEKIIVTPSHHRVHHAINPIYIDKNYGGILIVWDKLFGTFQEELPNEKPVYGITRQVGTWNPIKINFQHLSLLIKDAWRTTNIWDKFRIWFMPTGWRPADVAEKFPLQYTKNANKQEKYMPSVSIYLKVWAWIQLTITFLLMLFLMSKIAVISKTTVFIYATFIFLSVYSYTSLMDKSRYAWLTEILRMIYALAVINFYGGWFTLDNDLPQATIILSIYFVFSAIVSLAFEYFEFKSNTKLVEAQI
ncbi:sterol desaturase family protein [Sphingobacteriales bacterium UPWRP_1]|nr:sterol desaturase [Sphingobacteriales bacterium TSM_CSS]PSJ78686.1 sterol desaturase family protein [Sphingobacteriales bacterium UPWRP_1]